MFINDYCQLDAHALAILIKKKELSAKEVLDFAVQRMHEVNPILNAIVTDCSDWGYQKLSEMKGSEPFYGVPVLVKDLGFAMAGIPHSAGSGYFAGTIPQVNSDFIQRLLQLGMIPFARTNSPELGLSYVTEPTFWGPTRNPWDLSLTPGGSSGGSAAAVAAGIAPVATASDGGGSIRIPAACCGLFGFKPTPNVTPTGPWSEESWSGLSCFHMLTRSLRDSASLFSFLSAGNSLNINKRRKRIKTIAILQGAFADVPVAPPFLTAMATMRDCLEALGYQVIEQSLPLNQAAIGDSVMAIIAANTMAEIENQQQIIGRPPEKNELEPVTWEFLRMAKSLSASQLIQAKNQLYQCMQPLHQLFNSIDLILTPALAQLPLPIGSLNMDQGFEHFLIKNVEFSPFTSLFNQAGLPAMTIPVMRHNHLPISVQLAAGKGQDWQLLYLAEQLVQGLPDFTAPVMNPNSR